MLTCTAPANNGAGAQQVRSRFSTWYMVRVGESLLCRHRLGKGNVDSHSFGYDYERFILRLPISVSSTEAVATYSYGGA